MRLSRRKALQVGSGLGVAALAGCAGLPFVGPRLTLTMLNFDSEKHFLYLEILRAEGTERSESIVLQEEFELQPDESGDTEYEVKRPDILESRKYVVRASLSDDQSVRATHRFYPDCTGGEDPNEELLIAVRRDPEDSEPYIEFRQNKCGTDSWWF